MSMEDTKVELIAKIEELESLAVERDKQVYQFDDETQEFVVDEHGMRLELIDDVDENKDDEDEEFPRGKEDGISTMDVSAWLLVQTGEYTKPNDIMILDIDDVRLHYRFKGSSSTMGILLKDRNTLCEPSPHEHKFRRTKTLGVPDEGPQKCSCGVKAESNLDSF